MIVWTGEPMEFHKDMRSAHARLPKGSLFGFAGKLIGAVDIPTWRACLTHGAIEVRSDDKCDTRIVAEYCPVALPDIPPFVHKRDCLAPDRYYDMTVPGREPYELTKEPWIVWEFVDLDGDPWAPPGKVLWVPVLYYARLET